MAKVEVYSSMFCGFCHRAKQLLKQRGIAFTEIDVGGDDKRRAEMIQRANGRRTVPQIFIDGRHVGGCEELYDLDRQGGLAPLTGPAQ